MSTNTKPLEIKFCILLESLGLGTVSVAKALEIFRECESQTLLNAQKTIREMPNRHTWEDNETYEIYRQGVNDAALSLIPKI